VAFKNGARAPEGRGQTVDDAENTRLAAWANETRRQAVILNIQRQPGANVIDTVDRIKALLPQLQASTCPRRWTCRC
jgi:multidrug efflux pump